MSGSGAGRGVSLFVLSFLYLVLFQTLQKASVSKWATGGVSASCRTHSAPRLLKDKSDSGTSGVTIKNATIFK